MLVNRQIVGHDIRCTQCDELTDVAIEWHGTVEFGKDKRDVGGFLLCRKCAQHLMRILLEDIISYDNGRRVSLLNVMYHGEAGQFCPTEEENLRYGRFTHLREF